MISNTGSNIPSSTIRNLVPFAEDAKASGLKVFHLNVGQPDFHTPEHFWKTIQIRTDRVLSYAPSDRVAPLKEAVAGNYSEFCSRYDKGISFSRTR